MAIKMEQNCDSFESSPLDVGRIVGNFCSFFHCSNENFGVNISSQGRDWHLISILKLSPKCYPNISRRMVWSNFRGS